MDAIGKMASSSGRPNSGATANLMRNEDDLIDKVRSEMGRLAPTPTPAGSSVSSLDSRDSERDFDENESSFALVVRKEIKERRRTLVNTFRISSTTSTTRKMMSGTETRRPTSSYRRETPLPILIKQIVMDRACELHRMASAAFEKEDFQGTIAYLTKALVLNPDNCDYYIERGEAYLQISDFQSAVLNYRRACILEPDCDRFFHRLAFIYYLRGQSFFDEQKYDDALESFSRAVELLPDSLEFHTRSIACLAALQRHGECLSLVNKRLEIERDNADLFVMRARLHNTFRNDSLCYFDVVDALKLDPDHKEAKSMLSVIHKRSQEYKSQAMRLDLSGKRDESIAKISSAIDVDPSIPEFHVYRSALLRRDQNFSGAVDDLLLAMDKTKHDESHPVHKEAQKQFLITYNDFAVDCFNKGFYEEAIILLNKAIKSEKQEVKLYMNRGDCFYKTRELHFALSDYLQALDLEQTNDTIKVRLAAVYNDLGILEYQERRYEQAEDFFSVAISYNPRMASFYVSRARARYMLQNQETAQIDVLSALHIDNNNKEVVSLFTRLFPGKTTTESLSSQLGEMVGMALTSVISEIMEDASGSDRAISRSFSPKHILPNIKKASGDRHRAVADLLKSCMDEKEFKINIIKGKKKLNDLVESVIAARQSLEFKGPRVKGQEMFPVELPSWVDRKSEDQTRPKVNSISYSRDVKLRSQASSSKPTEKIKALTFLKA